MRFVCFYMVDWNWRLARNVHIIISYFDFMRTIFNHLYIGTHWIYIKEKNIITKTFFVSYIFETFFSSFVLITFNAACSYYRAALFCDYLFVRRFEYMYKIRQSQYCALCCNFISPVLTCTLLVYFKMYMNI